MRIPLGFNGQSREAICDYVKRPSPQTLFAWRAKLSSDISVQQMDSLELLESAYSKWQLYKAQGRTVSSDGALLKLIEREPLIDALGIVAIRARWAKLDGPLGVCQFRRTWCHNLAIDYLAVHPASLTEPKAISGVGTALLLRVATLANQIKAKKIWLETTDLSVHFYARLFKTDDTSDIVSIPAAEFYRALKERIA
jgi:hypothetical protein